MSNQRYVVLVEVSADPEEGMPGHRFSTLKQARDWAKQAVAEGIWGARRAYIGEAGSSEANQPLRDLEVVEGATC